MHVRCVAAALLCCLSDAFHPSLFKNSRAQLPLRVVSSRAPLETAKPLITTPPGAPRKRQKPLVKLPDLSQSAFPIPPEGGYDIIVIGSGPGGEATAAYAAKLGKKVAVIEKKAAFGGPTGLTSKAIREAAKRITKAVDQVGGDRRRQVKGLWKRGFSVLKAEAVVLQVAETRDRLRQSGADLFIGAAEFVKTSHDEAAVSVRVCRPNECVELSGSNICIATGSRSYRPDELRPGVPLPWTKDRVVCATEIGSLAELPNAVAIIGGGVIAVEYATVFAEMGVGVSLITKEDEFLPFLEPELRSSLRAMMVRSRILFVDQEVASVRVEDDCVKVAMTPTTARPKVDRVFKVDMLLYSGGRVANSDELACEQAGVNIGKYGRVLVDASCRTSAKMPVYAIGDVIGPPGLASAAQQQGRALVEKLFTGWGAGKSSGSSEEDVDVSEVDSFFAVEPSANSANLFGSISGQTEAMDAPLTLWTIPEIASVGLSADQATANGLSGVVEGRAYFKDSARGRLAGGEGFLKVVAQRGVDGAHTILGVHIIGEGANELIQLGSILVHGRSTLEQVSRTPFAAVTLSGLYQMACDSALFVDREKAL